MSWFSEFTSKAEAILDRLDQNAAQALQNPDGFIKGSKLLEPLINNEARSSLESQQPQPRSQPSPPPLPSPAQESQLAFVASEPIIQPYLQDFEPQAVAESQPEVISDTPNPVDTTLQPATSIQTINNGAEDQHNKVDFKFNDILEKTTPIMRDYSPRTRRDRPIANGSKTRRPIVSIDSPVASDVRESIKRSLQEYSTRQTSSSNAQLQTPYTSHYDDRPQIIPHNPSPTTSTHQNDLPSARIYSSSSFSIDLPENQSHPDTNNNLATRLLKQAALKKRSSFNLQTVISRLANQGNDPDSLFGVQLKINMRRAQMRMASYARRLNYYYRAYPKMKYIALGYLVLLQVLIVYVLLFYQSTSSQGDLSQQVKQQQQELFDNQLNSEKNHIDKSFHQIIAR